MRRGSHAVELPSIVIDVGMLLMMRKIVEHINFETSRDPLGFIVKNFHVIPRALALREI